MKNMTMCRVDMVSTRKVKRYNRKKNHYIQNYPKMEQTLNEKSSRILHFDKKTAHFLCSLPRYLKIYLGVCLRHKVCNTIS